MVGGELVAMGRSHDVPERTPRPAAAMEMAMEVERARCVRIPGRIQSLACDANAR